MSIAFSAAWEVRPTVGSDTNGGGYDPAIAGAGTDFSQQDSPNSGGSNSSTTDGVGAGSTTIVSATAAFTSALIGNIIFFDGAWYAVSAVGSSTTITVDRNTTSGTGLTLNIGGALATVAQAMTNGNDLNLVWIKGSAGDYNVTSTGTLAHSMRFVGYGSTRGDNVRAVWKTSTNSVGLIEANNKSETSFSNIEFRCTAGTPGVLIRATGGNPSQWNLINCLLNGGANCIDGDNAGSTFIFVGMSLFFCEVKNATGHGITNDGAIAMYGCYVHDNAGNGVNLNVGGNSVCSFDRTTFYNNNTAASNQGGLFNSQTACNMSITNCNFYSNVGDGIYLNSWSGQIVNSIFYGNSGYAINQPNSATQTNLVYVKNSAFGANSSGNFHNLGDPWALFNEGPITLTADPFTNPSGGDFSLNSTSGGGAACKQAGFPTAMP